MAYLASIAHYVCPRCGLREAIGERCICGLLWNEQRRSMRHYAVLLNDAETEVLRHKLARKLTYRLLHPARQPL